MGAWSCPIPTSWQVSGGGPPPQFNNLRDIVLDERVGVTEEDWRLAGIVAETSTSVREHVQGIAADAAWQREEAATARHARHAVVSDTAVTENRVTEVATRIRALVTEGHPEGVGVRAIQHRMSTRQKAIFAEALMLAAKERWVVEIDEPGQGEARRVLHLPAS